MPTLRRTYDKFEYIVYEKKTKDDFLQFKEEVMGLERDYDARKDILVDLSKCDNLISPEIGSLAKMAGIVKGAKKHLRLVVQPSVKSALEQMTLATLDNVVFYQSMKELLAQLKKEQTEGPLLLAAEQGSETLALEGSLTGPKIKEMSALVQSAFKGNAKRIILDLTKVKTVDTVCVSEFLHLDEKAKAHAKSLVLANPAKEVRELLHEASLDQILAIEPRG